MAALWRRIEAWLRDHQDSWPTCDDLAREMQLDLRYVRNALSELSTAGLATWTRTWRASANAADLDWWQASGAPFQHGRRLIDRLQHYYAANPDEELTEADIALKLGCRPRTARNVLSHLYRTGLMAKSTRWRAAATHERSKA